MTGMTSRPKPAQSPFTAPERDLLRHELCRHFGEDPSIADGLFLRTWRGGERRGQPKIPPAVQTMLERGLLEVRISNRGPGPSSRPRGWLRCGSSCWTAGRWTRTGSGICGASWS
jgi:hypothetical protein